MEGISVESFLRVGFLMSREDNDGDKTPSPSTLRKWFDISTYLKRPSIPWDGIDRLLTIYAASVIQRAYQNWRKRKKREHIIQLYLSF